MLLKVKGYYLNYYVNHLLAYQLISIHYFASSHFYDLSTLVGCWS